MSRINEFNSLDVVEKQYPLLRDFIMSYISFRELEPVQNELKGSKDFWIHTTDGHLVLAIMKWCSAFESVENKNPMAWHSLQTRLLHSLKISLKEWMDYRTQLLDFRNQYALYIGLVLIRQNIPSMDLAFQAALIYDEWMREYVQTKFLGPSLSEELVAYEIQLRKTISVLCRNN
ncbi:hypothetical protein ASG81_23225 [Paenibacillus sp. Soil522]|nr:hypothetical protein ASG81_23225 [Paenibacillus sp. Soil522]